ncbi:malonyl-coa decarboxylase, mitochondrial [Plakobranchus ocellatus]|uniref:Malonyl-coa decarboxylase, mitochondrial n=1 Tax=Plakobranchus ocellatus TaxID=259542 RepID=A0AAV4BVJ9_9GAST|nr:malonyl-coa decarboxylase, mitochondrial [Plakobranchus ocellatus]
MQAQIPSKVSRPYCSKVNGTKSDEDFLQKAFSDINANLLTTEAHCSEFVKYYTGLSQEQKGPFLCLLAKQYGIDKDTLCTVAKSVLFAKNKEDPNLLLAAERMRLNLHPKHRTLFTHLSRVNGGVKFLVDLRADVLNFKQSNMSEVDGALYQELNSTLRELLMLWFTVGFLKLERITWSSPCDLVQKVSKYEAVHRIRTWLDIKQRLGPYRRCYIFTHNSMPGEPVVVLHTALTKSISSNIQSIIQDSRFKPSFSPHSSEERSPNSASLESYKAAFMSLTPPVSPETSELHVPLEKLPITGEEKEDPSQIQCAIFYSITSTQKGLQGIDMGNYLIKTAVKKLQEEFPHLQQFSSLSPIPGFRDWLLSYAKQSISAQCIGEDPGVPLLLPNELNDLAPFKQPSQASPLETFRDLVASHEWFSNIELTRAMVGPLMRLCANYLYIQKKRKYALNPVASFHLTNGAVLWRINFLADTSHRGLMQSCTLMVNYRYFLDCTDSNSQNYLTNHQIRASSEVLNLLQGCSYLSQS